MFLLEITVFGDNTGKPITLPGPTSFLNEDDLKKEIYRIAEVFHNYTGIIITPDCEIVSVVCLDCKVTWFGSPDIRKEGREGGKC